MRRTSGRSFICALTLVALAVLLAPAPAAGGEVSKTVNFALDEWWDLEATDGPVTLHRIRIEKQTGGLTKSAIFRPGNDEFLQTIQIQLEFSNDSSQDWEADLDIVWKDADGKIIDGYRDEEGLDDRERHDRTTVTLSTLKYGLERAKTLEMSIRFVPD